MSDTIAVSLDANPSSADRAVIAAGLATYNTARAGEGEHSEFAVLARDEAGTVVAGLVAETHWHWLYVASLWVAEPVRGRGLGSRLLTHAESEAQRRGCAAASVDTFEFQARGFYERHGYVVWGVLEGFPPGSRKYFLRKSLAKPIASAT